jgi:hypothetical protein
VASLVSPVVSVVVLPAAPVALFASLVAAGSHPTDTNAKATIIKVKILFIAVNSKTKLQNNTHNKSDSNEPKNNRCGK